MTDAMQQPTKAPSHADSHPRLYHYTGEHAFRSIVGTNTLWATYFEDLNDASEFKVLRTPLAEELGDRFISTVEAFAKRGGWQAETVRSQGGVRPAAAGLGKILMNNLYKATFGAPFSESLYPCFVSSFCSHKPDGYTEDNGLLSQWRGYGGGPDGSYCLVFDTRRFEALMREEQEAYQYFFMGLGVAHYFKDRKEMPPYFADLAERGKTIVEAILSASDPALGALFEPFVEGATTIKHRSFEEEREIRLIAMPLSQRGDEQMKSVPGYKSKFLRGSFTIDSKVKKKRHISMFRERSKLPIVRVIVGPALDQRRNEKIARKAVGNDIEVLLSKTPFIA